MNHNLKDLMKNKIFLTVPDRLNQLGKIFKKRGEVYDDNYHHFGTVLSGLFPNGLHLQTEEEHNRYALFLQLVHKLSRYANTIKTGGHQDSLDDICVYSQMLAEFDELAEYKQGLDRTDPRDKKIKDLELELRRLKNTNDIENLKKKAG
jgi:hypothetical protein